MEEYRLKGLEPREYQKTIAETAIKKNTLVVLPTGMGKTLIAVLVAIERLKQYSESKVLILSPTRPLSAQHKKSFEEFTSIDADEIILLTGKIRPEDRVELYKEAKVIVATPQTIENDLINNRLNLENFSFLTVDECHRSVKSYSYPMIAKKYMLQSKFPLILGLTASPGATHERIDEICSNLFIKAVEIRTDVDIDVEKYVQPVQREIIYVDLPEEFEKIKILLEEVLKDDLYWLREHHYTFTYKPTKKMLLDVQRKVIGSYTRGSRNYGAFWAILRVAGAIKIEHAMELLETQGIKFLYDFLKKVEKSKKKTDTRLIKDPRMIEAIKLTEELYTRGVEHPKINKIINITKNLLIEKPDAKIIVFANFRSTVDRINELLKKNGIKSEILIGQAIKEGKGLTQQQQIEVLNRFREREFSVLLGTQIIEEGIDVPSIEYAIFYEAVPSEIRSIQRRGRIGRLSAGKVIFLITKDTRDEAYYWASFQKEKKMKGILYRMKDKGKLDKKETLLDWVK